MKKVKNVQCNLFKEKDVLYTYFDFIKVLMNAQGKGFTIDDIRKRIKIMEKIDNKKENEEIEIEDGELDLIKKEMKTFKWGVVNDDLVKFDDYINSL